ncbi:PTS transporter subunit EIIC [Olsenella sp. YH-ols2221]|uniref:PTS transporter subunit EIIC n=1 Tax=Olsenella kribbiana TaxID=3115221 RepID=UPI002EDB13AF
MARDYTDLCHGIVEGVGGAHNITNVIHCATRLRFSLKDPSRFDQDALKKLPGVLGTAKGAGTYHVLIGNQVERVYDRLLELPEIAERGITKSAGIDDPATAAADGAEKIGLLDRFTRMMSDVFTPYIPLLATGGIASGVIGLLANMGIVTSDSLTYQTFYAIFYGLIYFFPIMLAFTAGRHFKCNPYVAAALGASIMYPGVSSLLVTGETVNLLGISFPAFNLSGSFIPILLAVFCMSYVERFLKEHLPESMQFILVPLVCLVLFVPLTIMVFGPLGGLLANGILAVYNVLAASPVLLETIFGAFFSLVILLGLHWAVLPIQLGILGAQGVEYSLAPGGMGNYAVLGICLAVMVFAKNQEDKGVAGSAAFTDFLCGITEPGLYGVILRNKKLIAVMICSGGLAGFIMGLGNVGATNFAFTGLLAFGAWFGAQNFPGYCIGILVSVAASFIATAALLKSGQVKDFD